MPEPNPGQTVLNFSPRNLEVLADILGIARFEPEHIAALDYAAAKYFLSAQFDGHMTGRRIFRTRLNRIADAATELKLALEDYRHTMLWELPGIPELDPGSLDALANAVKEIADRWPERGPNPRTARKYFALDLARLFVDCTGERPVFSRDVHNKPSGRFFMFVDAALKIIDQREPSGLERDVRWALDELAKFSTHTTG